MAIYIKELISLLKDKSIHIGRFEAPCCQDDKSIVFLMRNW